MPVSSPKGKKEIAEWFSKKKDIKTILDIGPGSGTYFDLLATKKYAWKAIEIWAPYIKFFKLEDKYDEIRIGDVRHTRLPSADCCIAGDVLEHLPKKDAIKVFKRIDKKYKHVVVSIPLDSDSQSEVNGNQFERHISMWSQEELEELIPDIYKKLFVNFKDGVGCTMGVFLK